MLFGPDVVDPDFPDKRGDTENGFGILDVMLNEIEDPNHDVSTQDSFLNNYLLSMLGVPSKIGELRAGFGDFLEKIDAQFLDPLRELLGDIPNPFDPIINW